MQDYWNDPPDAPEPPDWYMTLEDALTMDPPQAVADAVRKAMEAWVEEYYGQYDVEPDDTCRHCGARRLDSGCYTSQPCNDCP